MPISWYQSDCSNFQDDDNDGDIDCADSDCAMIRLALVAVLDPIVQTSKMTVMEILTVMILIAHWIQPVVGCTNGIDDDNNGQWIVTHSVNRSSLWWQWGETDCTNGIDDDEMV